MGDLETTIRIDDETHKALELLKSSGQTYNDVVVENLEENTGKTIDEIVEVADAPLAN